MEKELILLVGPIGSGKTTFAETLANETSIRISQDEMGRKAYLEHFKAAIRDGIPRIIIDRMSFNNEQRDRFIKPARDAGYCVTVFEFKLSRDICFDRALNRKNHPTIGNNPKDINGVLNFYYNNYEPVDLNIIDNYNEINHEGY